MKTNGYQAVLFMLPMLLPLYSALAQHEMSDSGDSHPGFEIRAQVDRRVELFTIVARLAGLEEYATNTIKPYAETIDRHFEPYKNHAAIQFAQDLREKHSLGYDAVVTMAVHVSPPPELEPRVPFEKAFTDGGLDDRWGSIAQAQEFLGLLRQFYTDAKCEKFFEAQADFYAEVEGRFQPVLDQVDLAWYPEFYGEMPGGTFYVYVLLDSRGNYGPEVVFSEKEKDIYALITTLQVDAEGLPEYGDRQLATLIHEFSHPFVNPLFFARKEEFRTAGERIFASAQQVRKIGYGNWESPVIESLVRAAVVRYMLAHETDAQVAYDRMIYDRNLGFIWVEELVHLLGAYENSREAFPTFRSFFPMTIGYFTDLSARIEREAEVFAQRVPKVIGTAPFQNSDPQVDPAVRELVITFDRPLDAAALAKEGGGAENPSWIKDVSLNESGTILTLKVALEPGTDYKYALKGATFRTPDGYALDEYVLAFRTE